jgi:UTP--glucose-1-phosphate uridylyltransferase
MVSEKPGLKQLLEVYDLTGQSAVALFKVPSSQLNRYGIVEAEQAAEIEGIFKVRDMVEKPDPDEAPSDMAIFGRYILLPEIFDVIKSTNPGRGGEIQLTDALRQFLKKRDIYARIMEGRRYDVGDKLGFLIANIEFTLRRGDMREEFLGYLKGLNEKNYKI